MTIPMRKCPKIARWIRPVLAFVLLLRQGAMSFVVTCYQSSRPNSNLLSSTSMEYSTSDVALEYLCASWDLPKTTALQTALSECPSLEEAILRHNDLSLWLENVGRIPKKRRRRIITHHPLLLARILESTNIHTIADILNARLGISNAQFKKMTRKAKFSHRWSRSNVRQLLYLFLDELPLTESQTTKLVTSHPQLLNYKPDTFQSSVIYFRDELELDVVSILIRRPKVLTYSVERRLRPTVAFLKDMGSEEWSGWKRIVEKYPQVLMHSVEGVFRPKLDFLETCLQLERSKDVAHIVTAFPPTLWLRQDLLQSKLDFLATTLKLEPHELRYVISTFPQLLGLSVENNLRPKIQYLLQHMTLEQLREFCIYQPCLLAYSLENRLRPRIELMQKHAISYGYSPPYLMSLSNVKFQQWVDVTTSTWSPIAS